VRIGSFFCLLVFFCLNLKAQNYPSNYFRYPLDSAVNLVSPFGTLRDNHFHSGSDLRTNGKEGLVVYAAADGYISRIKVQSGGYGKAVYIDHPNGYTTVYGHLQKYHGGLARYIHQYQYKNKTFEFDKIFEKPLLFVKKGDTLGFSGNSGSSTGPHVHFEYRDTKTEKIINPAFFGVLPYDTLAPFISQLVFYKFVAEGLMPKQRLIFAKNKLVQEDSFWVWKDTLVLDPEMYGVGVEAYDYIHNAKDPKGIFGYTLSLNGEQIFKHELNRFSFDETKYINTHIDYPYYKLERTRIQKCFIDDGNKFSNYITNKSKGKFLLNTGESGFLMLKVYDVNGNNAQVKVNHKVGSNSIDKERQNYLASVKGKNALYPLQTNYIRAAGFEAKLDPGDIYDTIYYYLKVLPRIKHVWAPVYQLHQSLTPLHRNMDIAVKVDGIIEGLESKLGLVYFNKEGDNPRSMGGTYSNGWVRGKASNFGNYSVMIDTVPPSLKQVFININPDPSDTLLWTFETKDNFTGISSYEGYLNNRWILLDFDGKNNLLTYRFDEIYEVAKNDAINQANQGILDPTLELRIRVSDPKGNQTEKTFIIPFNGF